MNSVAGVPETTEATIGRLEDRQVWLVQESCTCNFANEKRDSQHFERGGLSLRLYSS